MIVISFMKWQRKLMIPGLKQVFITEAIIQQVKHWDEKLGQN